MNVCKISIEDRVTKKTKMLIAHGKSPLHITCEFEKKFPQYRIVLLEAPKDDDLEKLEHFHCRAESGNRPLRNVPWGIEKIINVSNELAVSGETAASTSEQIAAAFVLNDLKYIPLGFNVVEAWERLGVEWQDYVKCIQTHYRDLLVI